MLQNNISFDVFYGRIIDPIIYNAINFLNLHMGTEKPYNPQVYTQIFEDIVFPYVEKLEPQNKSQYLVDLYNIFVFLYHKLKEFNIPLENILKPNGNKTNYFILRQYFLNLIDLLEETHPKSNEFNSFAYNYLFGGQIPKEIYIIHDINELYIHVDKLQTLDFEKFLKDKDLILTLTGCLFYKHEKQSGIFTEFLLSLKKLRKEYKKQRDSFQRDNENYKFYDMRQNTIKIIMNSTYGLMGQPTFRFSNKWLAKTITVHGRLTLKIAQFLADNYLKETFKL
jgi:hypothetical protein